MAKFANSVMEFIKTKHYGLSRSDVSFNFSLRQLLELYAHPGGGNWQTAEIDFLFILYATKIYFPIDFNGIQDLRIKQVFACVRVHLLCAWFATLIWIHHALQFQILCIFTKAPGATLKYLLNAKEQ